jgi:hypothetical protein
LSLLSLTNQYCQLDTEWLLCFDMRIDTSSKRLST